MYRILNISIILITLIEFLVAQNNSNRIAFEMSSAMYCDGSSSSGGKHGHAAVFLYFEYSTGHGIMSFAEQAGSSQSSSEGKGLQIDEIQREIDDVSQIFYLKTDIIDQFRGDEYYYGAFGVNSAPYLRRHITQTAYQFL